MLLQTDPGPQPCRPTESPFAKATEPWGGRLFIPSSSNHDDALGIVDCRVLFVKAVSQSFASSPVQLSATYIHTSSS